MDSGMFQPMQLAAVEALNSPAEWYTSVNETYSKRRALVEQIMQKLDCSYDPAQTGLFVWGQVPDRYSGGEELADDILKRKHIFITPGFVFGEQGDRYIRISLCTNETMLQEAIGRISSL